MNRKGWSEVVGELGVDAVSVGLAVDAERIAALVAVPTGSETMLPTVLIAFTASAAAVAAAAAADSRVHKEVLSLELLVARPSSLSPQPADLARHALRRRLCRSWFRGWVQRCGGRSGVL